MGGLETYVKELVPALLGLGGGRSLTLVVNELGRAELAKEPWAGEVSFTVPAGSRRGLRLLYELGPLGLRAGRDFDVLHSPALTAPLRTRAANVVVLADVTWLLVPDLGRGQAPTTRLWQAVVPRVARGADRVIAISQDSARGVVEHLRVDPARLDVVPLGLRLPEAPSSTAGAQLRATYGLGDGPLILSVGAKKRHKNQGRLIEALPAVRAAVPGAQLLLAGASTPWEDELQARAHQLGVAEHVHWAGYVPQADLEGLYALAEVFALPSLNEGFGLPVLEAMARGVPVVTSSTSSLPEVAGDAAVLVDPTSVDAIAAGLSSVLRDASLRSRLIAAGRERRLEFTWERTAELTVESWERAYAAGAGTSVRRKSRSTGESVRSRT